MSALRKQVLKIWKIYDKDGNGYLEDQELNQFLSELCSVEGLKGQEENVKSLIDVNGDGKLEFEELMAILED
jgi:Ca2+-binding EF-hand superfamily protein